MDNLLRQIAFSVLDIKQWTSNQENDLTLKLHLLPEEVLFMIMNYLKKWDVISLMFIHRNFIVPGKRVLLHTIVVKSPQTPRSYLPEKLNLYTFTTFHQFFQMLTTLYYQPNLNKRIIFCDDVYDHLNCGDKFNSRKKRVGYLQQGPVNVEIYSSSLRSYIYVTGNEYFLVVQPNSRCFLSSSSYPGNKGGIVIFNGSPIPSQNGKFIPKSIEMRNLSSMNMAKLFDLLEIESIKASGSWSSYNSPHTLLSPQSFSLLKELCLTDLHRFPDSFLMGLKMNTLTKIDVPSFQYDINDKIWSLFQNHRKPLITIGVRSNPKQRDVILIASRFGNRPSHQGEEYHVSLIFRMLKLEEFPQLKLLIYNGGNFHIERGGAKPSYYYLPY